MFFSKKYNVPEPPKRPNTSYHLFANYMFHKIKD